MAARATFWLMWRCVLAALVVLSAGCHVLFNDGFQAGSTDPKKEEPIGTVCDKGAFKCNDEYLLACSPDQKGWVKKQTCAAATQCDSMKGVCTICEQADMMRCNVATRESCSPDRSSWKVVDQCKTAAECSPNGCGPCPVPGALQCAVGDNGQQVLKECDQTTKQWVTLANCPNDVICMATLSMAQTDPSHWERNKCEGKCNPGEVKCDGTLLLRCPNSGLDWMTLAPCDNEALCNATLTKIKASSDMGASVDKCEPGCGTPGTARCTGNTLERCSLDRLSWDQVMQCPADLQCSTTGEGGCVRCTPGEFQCNGAKLEKCSATNAWEQVDDCLQPALCTLSPDANGLLSTGSCRDPVCPRPGAYSCGSDTDPKVAGATLYFCDTDQTALGQRDTCATPQLCSAADGECKEPVCEAGRRRCGPTNSLEVQVCNAGRTGWDLVATCGAGEFCDPTDTAQPCKHECPAASFCSDRFLMACSNTTGVMQRAECQTRELCECGLNKTCPAGTLNDGCGKPVCGDTLPGFRCTDTAGTATQGPLLQACKAGRDGWATTTAQNCTSPALCYPGAAPYYKDGYCALCPTAGEVACDGTTSTHTCSTDRKSWTGAVNCGFGCVVDASTMDYCAACTANELRCSGNLTQLLSCSVDRKSTPVQKDCPFGCVNSGTADYCGTCAVGEKRCTAAAPGSLLQTCSTDQQSLGMNQTCSNGCIDSGRADYCADCVVGTSQCSGAGVRTCGADGHWGAVSACGNGCVTTTNGADYCGGCSANELRCSGSTLQQCAADQRSLTPLKTCTDGCIDSGMADYCAACAANERRCSGSSLQQCSADRSTLTTLSSCDFGCINDGTTDYCAACADGELRCNGATLQTCRMDQTGLIDSQNCTNGCYDSGTADYCQDCRPGATRCGTGGMQTCGSNGRWGTTAACLNGTSCYGNSPLAYCGDCKPGDRRCTGSAVFTCDSVGHWSTTATETCTRACVDSGDGDYCAECSQGDTSCSGSTRLTCDPTTGRYPATGSNCGALGCWGTTPSAQCGVCSAGESQCSGSTRQECSNGTWHDMESCADGCINSGTSDFCAVCPMGGAECVMNDTSRRTCVDGRWTTPAECPNKACVGTDCAACSPNDTQCAANDPTSFRTCSPSGTWGTPALCPKRACANDHCVDCMPNSTDCADDTNLITCSASGSWGSPSACTTMACVGTGCADCQPDAMACVDSSRQKVCDSTGHWVTTRCVDQGKVACLGTACVDCMPGTKQCNAGLTSVATCSPQGAWQPNPEGCMYGCTDNGDADFCTACPDGRSECVGTTQIRTCDGTWMTSGCMYGCFAVTGGTADDYCRDCSDGATLCRTDTQPQSCDDQGHWEDGTPCDHYCLKGSCVECKPSSTMCQDATSRLNCSEGGSWSTMAEECPNGCANDDCVP